ncbi:MAG: hypothetical protein ACRD3M_12670 [Thermoanaerobaculia bacterium]
MTRLSESVPPVEVSRLLLAGLVAAGALVSVASEGRLSSFAGGFAAGAGSAFVLSFLKGRRRPAEPEARSGEAP